MPNLNFTLTLLGMNTTYSPHGVLPTLNVTFSPAFHNSPSTLPTTPKSQGGVLSLNNLQDAQYIDKMNAPQSLQNFNTSVLPEINIPYPIQTNPHPTQINTPNKNCNIPICEYDVDPSFKIRKNPQHSKQHHQILGKARTSTSNCSNLARDVTPSCCSCSYHQDYSTSNQVQNFHDKEDFHATPLKCRYKKKRSRQQLEDLDDRNSDTDYNESSTLLCKKKGFCIWHQKN